MKVLVAIISCHKFKARADAQRITWVPGLKIDYKFFLGRGAEREPGPDEVFLDVPDDYLSLPFKTRAVMKWAVDHGYDAVFKCDDDTYVFPERLIPPDASYCGRVNTSNHVIAPLGWCSGFAYWLRDSALAYIANGPEPDEKAEDLWVGKILSRNRIKCINCNAYIALSILPEPVWGHFHAMAIACCEFPGERMMAIHDLFTNPTRVKDRKSLKSLNPRAVRFFPIKRDYRR